MKIESKVIKVGNGAYVSLPKKILEAMGKKIGDKIVFEIKEVK